MTSNCSADKALAEARRAYLSKLIPSTFYGGFAGVALMYYTDVIGKCRDEGRNDCHPVYLTLRRFVTGAIMYPLSRFCIDYMYSFLTNDCLKTIKSDVVVSGLGGALCGLIFGTMGRVPDKTVSALAFGFGAMIIEHTPDPSSINYEMEGQETTDQMSEKLRKIYATGEIFLE